MVRKGILKLGYVYKKSLHTSEQEHPDVRARRKSWREHISENDVDHLVFLDESGTNTNMTKHYAHSKKNEQAVDSTPVNTPCSTTIWFSIRLNGKTSYVVYCDRKIGERFVEYLKTSIGCVRYKISV